MWESQLNISDYEDNNSEDNDFENQYNYFDIIYTPEEYNKSRFVIALCELHNNRVHGVGPNGNYIVYSRYKKLHMKFINETAEFINLHYHHLNNLSHDLFPNYRQIVFTPNYVKPEIVECIYLQPDGHCIAILKTFWIKIIQRSWKNVLKKRNIIKKSISGLRYRELTGKWPNFPGLRGLLTG
jgi:hypothetical protein